MRAAVAFAVLALAAAASAPARAGDEDAAAPAPPVRVIDMSDDEPAAVLTGPPPGHEFGDLVPDKYRKKQNLDATVEARAISGARARRLGFRIGGGVVDSSAAGAAATMSAAIVARAALGQLPLAIEGRLDAGERGGDAAKLWTAGAGAQVRWYPGFSGLSLAGGGRVELRTADAVAGMAVDRFGVAATVGLGWELGAGRYAIELRGEQGLTELAGARPRAALLEVGFNL